MFKSAAALLLLVAATSAANLDSFTFRGKPYFIVSNEKVTWFDAESLCASRGLQLASIDDETEFAYVKNQIIARGLQNSQVWIGGTEIGAEDNYYWTNTGLTVELPYWDETEIVDVKNRCMVFYRSLWRHSLCTTLNFFICESPNAPTTTLAPPTTPTIGPGRR